MFGSWIQLTFWEMFLGTKLGKKFEKYELTLRKIRVSMDFVIILMKLLKKNLSSIICKSYKNILNSYIQYFSVYKTHPKI